MLLRIVHRLGRRTASAATISSCRRITALHSWAMNIFRSRWCSSRFRYSVWIIWIVLQLMEDCSGCVSGWLCAERTYRVLGKFQIGEPGCGRNPGLMRNCLSNSAPSGECTVIEFLIPDTVPVLEMKQLHMRYLLLDAKTGYRSQYHSMDAIISITAD